LKEIPGVMKGISLWKLGFRPWAMRTYMYFYSGGQEETRGGARKSGKDWGRQRDAGRNSLSQRPTTRQCAACPDASRPRSPDGVWDDARDGGRAPSGIRRPPWFRHPSAPGPVFFNASRAKAGNALSGPRHPRPSPQSRTQQTRGHEIPGNRILPNANLRPENNPYLRDLWP
jgi:hypothetical protein